MAIVRTFPVTHLLATVPFNGADSTRTSEQPFERKSSSGISSLGANSSTQTEAQRQTMATTASLLQMPASSQGLRLVGQTPELKPLKAKWASGSAEVQRWVPLEGFSGSSPALLQMLREQPGEPLAP